MNKELWSSVDTYLVEHFIPPDEALDAAVKASTDAGLPPIAVSATQGKFLHLLARLVKANNILEIGTLGGYSTIWMARAMGDAGRIVSLEHNPMHVQIATANIERAGLASRVEIRTGSAIELLPGVQRDGLGPFDMIFIDADKQSIPDYFEWALKLSHSGTLIIVDNVIRNGGVIDESSDDVHNQGVRRFNDGIRNDSRVSATTLQTVGAKGYDGFALVIVN